MWKMHWKSARKSYWQGNVWSANPTERTCVKTVLCGNSFLGFKENSLCAPEYWPCAESVACLAVRRPHFANVGRPVKMFFCKSNHVNLIFFRCKSKAPHWRTAHLLCAVCVVSICVWGQQLFGHGFSLRFVVPTQSHFEAVLLNHHGSSEITRFMQ